MRIGILVDGQAEYYSLKLLLRKIDSPYTILDPIYADMQPFAPPGQIARAAMKRIPVLLNKDVEGILILLDKEERPECTVTLWRDIKAAVEREIAKRRMGLQVQVVLKVVCFENWLIADPTALRSIPALLHHAERIERTVVPNRADNVDAQDLLNRHSARGRFDKVSGATAVCQHLDPDRAAENSRSFRRFLRVAQHAPFRDRAHSRRP